MEYVIQFVVEKVEKSWIITCISTGLFTPGIVTSIRCDPVVHTRNLAIKNARAEGPTTVLDVDGRHDSVRSLLTADGTADPRGG